MIGLLILAAIVVLLIAVACWSGRTETSGKAGDSVGTQSGGGWS